MEPLPAEALVGPVTPDLPLRTASLARFFDQRLLLLSFALWILFGLLTLFAATNSWLPGDLALARWVQSISWGPLASTFGMISWLSGGPQVAVAVLTVVAVFLVNRRAAPLALVALADFVLYDAFNSLVHKPRPVAGLIRVTENAGAYAFPSGHATFVVTIITVLVLCIGARMMNRRLLGLAAVAGLVVVVVVGLERIYVGAHYPSDVLGGFLLASAWLSLVLAIRRLSNLVSSRRRQPVEA